MWRATSAVTASSISPLTDSRTSRQPAHRMLAATRAASAGSRTCQPVTVASARPTSTPMEVATSVIRCQPSPTSAGERWRRPQVSRKYDQPALMAVARPLMASPCARLAQRARPQEGVVGLVEDQQRRDDDQHALDHGREVLGLVVAELVAAVGRLGRDVDGVERHQRRDQVDDALQRIRIERDAARHPVGQVLEAQTTAATRSRSWRRASACRQCWSGSRATFVLARAKRALHMAWAAGECQPFCAARGPTSQPACCMAGVRSLPAGQVSFTAFGRLPRRTRI